MRDPGAPDAAGRGARPRRRPRPAARRRSSTRSCTTPTPAALALEQLIAEVDPRNIVAHERPAQLLRGRRGLAARRQGGRAAAVPDRGSGAARAGARWSWARWSATSWATTRRRSRSSSACWRWTPDNMEALHARRRRSTSRPATTSGWRSPTRSCWSARPIPTSAGVLMLQIAALYENHLDDAARGFEWYRRAYLETPDAEGLQLVDQAAERHGLFEELIQIYEGARARATRADRAARGVAEDRAHLRGEAARSGARVRDAVRRAARRSGRARAAAQPGAAGGADQGLARAAGRLRARRPRAHRGGRARRAAAPARRGARAQDGRSVGRARRDVAQLRAGAREPGDAGGDPAAGARHRPLGRGDPGRGPPVRAGGDAAREAGDRPQRRLPGRARGQGSRCARSAPT